MRINLRAVRLRNGGVLPVFSGALLFSAALFGGNATFAEEMKQALPSVVPSDISYSGAFTQRVDFKLPAQRGLEPRLGLSYDSSRANAYGPDNLVGVGWRLTGLSSIQRANPLRAVPRFNSGDVWLLDGQELVPCGSYDKAGCSAGGTHATWVENYQRIKQIADGNTWEVTARDGTKYIYKSIETWIGDSVLPVSGTRATSMLTQYRYLLAEKVNTKGQKVTYAYECGNALDCQITNISYDIGEIRFHWKDRPDAISYAAGWMLGKSTERLQTVEVRATGEMLRTYDLSYIESPATGRSLLSSVTERGKDSEIVDGIVSEGTALPAYTFEYSGAAPDPIQVADISAENALPRLRGTPRKSIGCGAFGKDKKVYCIYEYWERLGRAYTTETPERQVSHPGSSPFWQLNYLKTGHRHQKTILLHGGSYTNTGRAVYGRGHSTYGRPRIVADFDGDGLDDTTGADGSDVKQYYSAPWSASSWGGYGEGGNTAADLNGDGLTDIFDPEPNHIEFHLSNGVNNFAHVYNHSLAPMHGGYRIASDFNGDGTTDFLIANNSGNSYRIYYTLGPSIVSGANFTLEGSCPSTCIRPGVVGDLNGDGLVDLGVKLSATKTVIYLNTGNSFQKVQTNGQDYEFGATLIPVGDVDENGVSEYVKSTQRNITGFGAERWALFDERPDLLNLVRAPLGSETRVTYEKHLPETQTDIPLTLFVVNSLETFDGRSVRATTDYTYAGARWAWRERRFLGFGKITATLPQNAGETGRPVIETTYMQDFASVGKIREILRKDGSGNLLQQRLETYVVNTSTLPYWSRNTETVVTDYLEGTARQKREVREFDDFGHVVRTVSHGDLNSSDGERDFTRWSYPNTDKYIVNKWASETVNLLATDGSIQKRMWRRWYYFDGANTSAAPPLEGYRTQVSEWTGGDIEGRAVQSVATYDAFGNMTTQADGLGNTTSYVYDGTYNLYPVEIRNPLYGSNSSQKKTLVWDMVCGVILSETEENGSVTTHAYDALCRKTQTDLPGGGRVLYSYTNWGDPTTSFNRTSKLHPNGAADIVEDVYFDGFGRTYLEELSG